MQDCSLFSNDHVNYKHVYHYKSSVFGHTLSTLAIYYSFPAITALKMAVRVDTVQTTDTTTLLSTAILVYFTVSDN